ncbi:MAG: TrmB family transcriptional regulator [Nitrosopumilus sp.]|nr:TrmB family transcriptional regulator [Nitrosopumilus sp.]
MSLEEFGLSKYEAQAYVTLISKGSVSAGELAYHSEIPRTKVYPTLLKLESKKLVIISKSKPIMCTAIAPEDAFDEIIHEQINKVNAMNTLISNLKKTSEESRKSRGSEERRYFHMSANKIVAQLQTMIEGSKSSIKIMTDQWGFGLLAECKEQLLAVLRRNLDIKVLVTSAQIGSDAFRAIPDGVEIRASEISQNCFIFDETELLMINSDNGKGAIFSSTEILGINQERMFSNIWKNAMKTKALADMSKTEAQEICKIIKMVNESGLSHILSVSMISKKPELEIFKMLEKNGISLRARSLEGIIEIIDAVMQITCSGHVNFEANTKSITVESKLNSGHSLPWVSILDGCLQNQGYKTRTIYQNNSSKGEKVHIKISKN